MFIHLRFGILNTLFHCFVNGQSEGDIRLVGATSLQGRLEIYHNSVWGTVCDDAFDDLDAIVVCKQIGSSDAYSGKFYTAHNGNGTIWLDNLKCDGSESAISSCIHDGWGVHNCDHGEDVGVRCFQPEEGELRLVGGSSFNNGRLEIFHFGLWGTICNDEFSIEDAKVACKQMNKRSTTVESYTVGNGQGIIWLDDVGCSGSETDITTCSHRGWGSHNCDHSEDVGVRCYGGLPEGDLRLVGGNCEREGRLEIYHNNHWGTVCDDSFSSAEALVACNQLRYRTNEPEAYTHGGGSGTVWLDNVDCSGTETNISSCSHRGWGVENCDHSEDVGIKCHGYTKVHGNWGFWNGWQSCSATRGIGNQQRSRQCNRPSPSCGGYACVGPDTELQQCSILSFQVDGSWGAWSTWHNCNVTCGGGEQKRQRICDNPAPDFNGLPCTGIPFDFRTCSMQECPVNGNWGSWSFWSNCSALCDTGTKTRSRMCNNPSPDYGGLYCEQNDTDTNTCNKIPCPDSDLIRHVPVDNESSCTNGMLGGVAGECIIVTLALMVVGQFAFYKIRKSSKEQEQNAQVCNEEGDSVQMRNRSNDYVEAPQPTTSGSCQKGKIVKQSGEFEDLQTDNDPNGIYDRLQSATYSNSAFTAENDMESTLYENLKT